MPLPPEDLIRAREELAKMRSELAALMKESYAKHATGGVYDRLLRVERNTTGMQEAFGAMHLAIDKLESAHKLLDQQHSDGLATIAARLGKLEACVASDGVSIPRILDRLAKLEAQPAPEFEYDFDDEPVAYAAVVKARDDWKAKYENTRALLTAERAAHRRSRQEGQKYQRIVTLVAGCELEGYPNWKTLAELDKLVEIADVAAANISSTHPQTAELLEAALKPFRS